MDPDSPKSPLDEGEIGDDDSKEFDDGYDENLMGDEEDKRRLAQMTEKEREQVLFDRSERRETLKIRFDIEKKLKSKAKKREQEKKQSKQVRAKKRLKASEIYSSDESSEESDEYTPENNKSNLNELSMSGKGSKINTRSTVHLMTSSSEDDSTASSEDSGSSSSEGERENDESGEERDGQIVKDDFIPTLADLKCLQLKRDKIEEWVYSPFFRETAIGLFVKISVGTVGSVHTYKIAQVTDITQGNKVYAINQGRNKTDKQCRVLIGRIERTYAMSFVSNRSFDEDDYNRWRDQINLDNSGMPTREHFMKKKRDLHRANNYEYKDEKDIAYEVMERSRFKDHPYNFALKKAELMGEKKDAEESNDFERARQIQQQIDELEEKAKELEKSRSSSTFSAISFVNERNRYKNIVESERALKESKSVKTEDPFTRRKCNPTIVHNKNNGDVLSKNSDDKSSQDGSKGQPDDVKNSNSTNGNKSMSNCDVTKSVDDLFQAHASIDLELDLDI